MFDALDLSLLVLENQTYFYESQGVELMIKIVKNKLPISSRAWQTIALALKDNAASCKALIDQGGLGLLFPIMMRKGLKGKNPEGQKKVDGMCLCE